MQISSEDVQHNDIITVGPLVTYSTILIKVFAALEAAADGNYRWVLKTDDDAYVNVPQTVHVRRLTSLPSVHACCCVCCHILWWLISLWACCAFAAQRDAAERTPSL